jgi:hypothetical protein
MAVQAWKHGCEGESTVEVKEREGRGMKQGREGLAEWRRGLVNRDGYV